MPCCACGQPLAVIMALSDEGREHEMVRLTVVCRDARGCGFETGTAMYLGRPDRAVVRMLALRLVADRLVKEGYSQDQVEQKLRPDRQPVSSVAAD